MKAGVAAAAFLCAVLALAIEDGPPYISAAGVRNAASRIPPALAGGSIARGSLFTVRGVRLGPTPPVRSAAGEERLGGGSVLVNGVPVPLYFASEDRLLARMPAMQATGQVQIAVRRNGVTGPARLVRVAEASPGLFAQSVEDAPELPAALQQGRRPRSAPGATVSLLGTGFGEGPLSILVGGKHAELSGRSRVVGIDGVERITIRVPAAAPLGCEVPVAVGVRGVWSNTAPITLETSQTSCIDAGGWVARELHKRGRNGFILLSRTALRMDAGRSAREEHLFDFALAGFSATKPADNEELFGLPPYGSCATVTGIFELGGFLNPPATTDLNAQLLDLNVPFQLPAHRMLYAGPRLRLSGVRGTRVVEPDKQRPEYYLSLLGGSLPGFNLHAAEQPLFLEPGTVHLSGEGSSDVGPFEAETIIPPALRWLNRDSLRAANRAKGVRLKWTGGGDASALVIAAALDDRTGAGGICMCTAAPGAHEFVIPPEMLANMPATGERAGDLPFGAIAIGAWPARQPVPFEASGLDSGLIIPASFSVRLTSFR